jgi:hypothetical protein
MAYTNLLNTSWPAFEVPSIHSNAIQEDLIPIICPREVEITAFRPEWMSDSLASYKATIVIFGFLHGSI